MKIETLLFTGLVPDFLVRAGIRRLIAQRLVEEAVDDPVALQIRHEAFVQKLQESAIAIHTDKANEQHYEVPPAFFEFVLGHRLKYSCGYWKELDGLAGGRPGTLDEAEETMLALTVERASIADGMEILELGCGWGSLSLFMAERFPKCRVKGLSNSADQKRFIDDRAKRLGLTNLEIVTADIRDYEANETFDRIISVEMFEHLRNYKTLLARVARWMRPDARLFVHVFSHREAAYPFEVRDETDWMAKNFFTGGLMPSDRLLLRFQDDVAVESHWRVSGLHYQKTAEAWRANLDRSRSRVLRLFEETYGAGSAKRRFMEWRLFFLACAEMWGYRAGNEWLVSHYLFRRRR